MGRNKIEKKKVTVSITLEKECAEFIQEKGIKSKSEFVNWLIRQHFNDLEK